MALVAGGQPDKPEDTTGGPHPHQLPVNTLTDLIQHTGPTETQIANV